MVLSALSFSLMGVCVKHLGGRLPVAEVVFARALISLLLSWWLLRRAGLSPWGRHRRLLVLRGVLGTVALFGVYGGLAWLPLAPATVLQYLYPTFTAALAWGALGERFGRRLGLAMVLGWTGVALLMQPVGGPGTLPALAPLGVVAAVTGALFTALAYVSVRTLAGREHPLVIIFWFPLVSLPLALPLVLLEPIRPQPIELLWLLGVGLFTQLGQLGLTAAIVRLPAARATAISYVQVPMAALWGWLWFAEPVGLGTAGGAGLVLLATLLSLTVAGRQPAT
ncbi:MAG: DMT family transporter [Synechococcus sp. Tobar2m-G35]|nr:DMT family transporter [Synechococcus sp. Tobar2m-G35]